MSSRRYETAGAFTASHRLNISPAILYLAGVAAFVYGWYVYWQTGIVEPDPFVIAGLCVVSAAGVQVVRDLWRRLRR